MASRRSPSPDEPFAQSIPLQNLSRPPDIGAATSPSQSDSHRSTFKVGHIRSISRLSRAGHQYQPLAFDAPANEHIRADSPSVLTSASPVLSIDPQTSTNSQSGLFFTSRDTPPQVHSSQALRPVIVHRSSDAATLNYDTNSIYAPEDEDDLIPLTKKSDPDKPDYLSVNSLGQRHDRMGSKSSDTSNHGFKTSIGSTTSRLGDDLRSSSINTKRPRGLSAASISSRLTISPRRSSDDGRSRSRSPSASPLKRMGSMLRDVSERVVNISNDSDVVEQNMRRRSTKKRPEISTSTEIEHDDIEAASSAVKAPSEDIPSKTEEIHESDFRPVLLTKSSFRNTNPLRGRTLGMFGPESKLRKWLLEVLVHPLIEPVILVLIVVQTVLLSVEAASVAVYDEARSRAWGMSNFDYAILGLFVVYTLEIVAHSIVSGFVFNPTEYSTIDRSRGLKAGILGLLSSLFTPPQEDESEVKKRRASVDFQPSIVRTFTGMPLDENAIGHGRMRQKQRLAKRAFLRHSFNRLDFLAVVSYWISFGLQIAQFDVDKHVYVFDMLSCLRILRLLGLTSGTTIILRSLKKAAPLLLNIAFLIGFFWLIFGIVGVQSFKSSLRRTCVWVGDDGSGSNYTQNDAPENIQFCGGYLQADTGIALPWLKLDGSPGTSEAKGYFCPQGSLCVEGAENPYNGTVSFDNIVQSLEQVFVIISSNTFSDIMYYLTQSDYLISALFYAAGIVVMALWMVNLLIAVIASSFQVIREENRQSAFTAEQAEQQDSIADAQLSPSAKKPNKLKRAFDKTFWLWIFLITVDLVIMCLRSSRMSDSRADLISNTETVVTSLLLLEILIRFIVDWRNFFKSKQNIADLFIAIITTVMQFPPVHNSGQPYAWLTVFQIARIYRVVLAVSVTRELIMLVAGNALGLLNLIVFVFLFTYLAAIMASQLFRGDLPPQDFAGTTTQIQFFNLWNSFIGMYIIFSSENWTTIMYNITNYDVYWNTAWLGAAFCIIWFILGDLIILNMFIAAIQESFDISEDEKRLQQVKQFLKQKAAQKTSGGNIPLLSMFKPGRQSMLHRDALEYGQSALDQLLKDAVVSDFLEEQSTSQPRPQPPLQIHSKIPSASGRAEFWQQVRDRIMSFRKREPNPFYTDDVGFRANEEFDTVSAVQNVQKSQENRRRAQRQYLQKHPKYNVSLFIFKARNPIRRFCQKIVGPSRGEERPEGVSPEPAAWYAFSAITYIAIVAMVVIACIATPLYQKEHFASAPNGLHNNWLVWTDMVFAIFFTVEALIKTIADGFFFTPNAFARSIWGFIDIVVLLSLWLSVITTLMHEDSITRGVGALKALRALRLLNVSDNARSTFHSLLVVGGYKVLSAAFVSLSLLVPFAILGLNLFNGTFAACNDQSFSGDLSNCVGEFNNTPYSSNWTVLAPRTAANPWYNFDTFASSLFILFQIVSQEGWTSVLQSGMNIVGVGQQPQAFNAQGNAVFFIVFNLLGAVFILTLFISVYMRNYSEQTGVAFLTSDQRAWLEFRKLLKQVRPTIKSITPSSSKWRKRCFKIASKKSGIYPRFITTVLLTHLLLLALEIYPEPVWWVLARECTFLLASVILIVNISLRIFGLTWTRFQRSSWDLFSLFAVFGTFVTSLMWLGFYRNRTFEQLHKLFCVAVCFLLIPRNTQLDQLFKTAAASLPLVGNLLATWFVLFLVFAIALTQAFSLTRFGPNEGVNVNFRNVPKALILLFRMSIGEGWNQIMEDFANIRQPLCVTDTSFYNGDCGSAAWARGLLVAWNIISMYVFVSLFVALVFESFSYVYQSNSSIARISRLEIRRFKQAWADFDPEGKGFVSKADFPRLLGELSGVFSMRIYDGDFTVRNIINDCKPDQPISGNPKARIVAGLDLDKLNKRLNSIPIKEIRARRAEMNAFYNEVLLSADIERGIPFTPCLMILAHYSVISESKNLRLEEFLQRKARLQRVRETMKRDTVRHFFNVLSDRRKFRNHVNEKRSSRLEGPPQIEIPQIYVENLDDGIDSDQEPEVIARDFTSSEREPLSPRRSHLPEIRIDTTLARPESLVSARSQRGSRSSNLSPTTSPVATPRRMSLVDSPERGRRSFTANRSPPVTPTLGGHSRQGSAQSSLQGEGVMEGFEGSAWAESLRRSFTMKRSSDKT